MHSYSENAKRKRGPIYRVYGTADHFRDRDLDFKWGRHTIRREVGQRDVALKLAYEFMRDNSVQGPKAYMLVEKVTGYGTERVGSWGPEDWGQQIGSVTGSSYRPNLFGMGKKREAGPPAPPQVVRDGQWHYVFGKERERGLDRGMSMADSKAFAEQKADEDWYAREGKMNWNPRPPAPIRRTYGLPPPRPSPRRPGTRERLGSMVDRYQEEERPFEPGAPREHYTRPHHFSVNSNPALQSLAVQEAIGAPARTKRILAAAAERTRHPEVRAMILEDRGGQWSEAVKEAEQLSQRVEGAVDRVPLTAKQMESYIADIVRLEALNAVIRRGPRMQRNSSAPSDPAAVEALELWIDNTAELSPYGPSGRGHDTVQSLLKKIRSGRYDPDKAPKQWLYLVEWGARDYAKHQPEDGPWNVQFNPATRQALAERYAKQFEQEVAEGQWGGA